MATKYITFTQHGSNITEIVVFSDTITHAEMTMSLPHAKEIIGAGFIEFNVALDHTYDDHIVVARCFGKSDSIGIISHPNDTSVATRRLLAVN